MYSACKKEFESCLRKITMLGYGIVIISHDAKRIEKTPDGSEIEILSEKNDLQTVKNAEEIIKNFFFQCSLKESDIEEKYYSELLKECQ